MAFTKLKNCLACSSKKLRQVLDLKKQPLANAFLKDIKIKEKIYDLKVNGCLNCTHLQLSIAVDPKKIYKRYDYVSGTTQTYKNFMKKFYKFCIKNNKKLIYNDTPQTWEFYDLEKDPRELKNIFEKKSIEISKYKKLLVNHFKKNNIKTKIKK